MTLVWTIEVSRKALDSLKKLSIPTRKKIFKELRAIEQLDDPRDRGEALAGNLIGYWSYRVEEYRIIAEIIDKKLIVLVIYIERHRAAFDRHRTN